MKTTVKTAKKATAKSVPVTKNDVKEVKQSKPVIPVKKVLPQTAKQAEKILLKKEKELDKESEKNKKAAIKEFGSMKTPEKAVKKEEKPKAVKTEKSKTESMETLAIRLYKAKAKVEVIEKEFLNAYKAKKNITDKKFIQQRAQIYMTIAEKRVGK